MVFAWPGFHPSTSTPNTCWVFRSSLICNRGSVSLLVETSRSKRPSSGSRLALSGKETSKLTFAVCGGLILAGVVNSDVAANRPTARNHTASLVRVSLFMNETLLRRTYNSLECGDLSPLSSTVRENRQSGDPDSSGPHSKGLHLAA